MSEPVQAEPGVRARDVWVKFLIRYHRAEVTLRETFVRLIGLLSRRSAENGQDTNVFWALRGIDLEVRPGEVVGIVGRNGSGKSTLLKALAGIYEADRGDVHVVGKVGCLLSFGVGFNPN